MEKTLEKFNIPKTSKADFEKAFALLATIKLSKKEASKNISASEYTENVAT